jgi:tetratricopeptide (TPR) repeat protein
LLAESRSLYQEIGDRFGEGECLNFLGHAARSSGDCSEARWMYAENLSLRKEIGDLDGEANAYLCQGVVEINIFHLEEAMPLLEKSLRLSLQINNRQVIRNNYEYMCRAVWLQGRYEQVEQNLREARAEGRLHENFYANPWDFDLHNLENLGYLSLSQGDCRKAAQYFEEYLNYCQRNRKQLIHIARKHLGDLAITKRKSDEAAVQFTKVISLSRE